MKTIKDRVPFKDNSEQERVHTSKSQGRFPHITVIVMIAYLTYLICTPYFRFEILETIKMERILAALSVISLAATGRLKPTFTRIAALIIILYLWMLTSYQISPYHDVSYAIVWLEDYWKTVLLYFLVFYSLKTLHDVGWYFAGWVAISFCYQMISMADFLRDGSYVYQQGIRRMVGVWSEGGLGAANAYGLLALMTMTIAIFLARRPVKAIYRLFLSIVILLSLLSLIFSGTRGAFLVALILLALLLRKSIFKIKIILGLALVLYISFLWMPPEYKHRYFGMIFEDKNREQTGWDELAEQSAQSRWQGFVDGFKLALLRPMVGFGPGSSAYARRDYYPIKIVEGPLQLHNLLGQVMADIGFLGAAIFLTIVGLAAFQLRKSGVEALLIGPQGYYPEYCSLVRYLLLSLFVYGFFDHSLYKYSWVVFWAISDALLRIKLNHGVRPVEVAAIDEGQA